MGTETERERERKKVCERERPKTKTEKKIEPPEREILIYVQRGKEIKKIKI